MTEETTTTSRRERRTQPKVGMSNTEYAEALEGAASERLSFSAFVRRCVRKECERIKEGRR